MGTKVKIYKKKRFWAGILLAQFILLFICSKIDFLVAVYADFFESQKAFHQKITAGLSFSVGDIFYITLIFLVIYVFFDVLRKSTRNRALVRTLIFANLLYFVYQLFWGMLYFQKPILAQLPEEEITLKETKQLAVKYLNLCKQSRTKVGEDQSGVFKFNNSSGIESEILRNQNTLPDSIVAKSATNLNVFKPSLFTGVMSYSGILGYYNPFTAEAQYNAELPSTYLPFTLAHESAHQLGYAREQEANFIGYLIGKNSGNADLRYSTEYAVLKSLLNALAEDNPEFVEEVIGQYSPAMQRDRQAEKDFVMQHKGLLDVFFGFTNDLFLKSNRQEGSITYSYFVDLLVRFERTEPN